MEQRRRSGVVPAMVVSLLVFGGCGTPRYAVIDGQRRERPSFGYTDGRYYAIQHNRAYPDVLDAAHHVNRDDGMITGRACGNALFFYSDWYGAQLTLDGEASIPWQTSAAPGEEKFQGTVQVQQLEPGHRLFTGHGIFKWGQKRYVGLYPIDLDVGPNGLRGALGDRTFDLKRVNDRLVGWVTQRPVATVGEFQGPFVIIGPDAFQTMDPSSQAVILLTMLSCNTKVEHEGKFLRGFSLVPYTDKPDLASSPGTLRAGPASSRP
jgi:hypothetical protein